MLRGTPAQYVTLLQRALPMGRAWTRSPVATLTALLGAMADSLARLHADVLLLIDESDPRTALHSLAEWERDHGLPDACSPQLAETTEARRAAVIDRILAEGGQSPASMIGLAERIGRDITIQTFAPFRCGAARLGTTPLAPGRVRYTWRTHGLTTAGIGRWRCGLARLGTTPLGWFARDAEMECRLGRAQPAHSRLQVAYQPVSGGAWAWSDGSEIAGSDGAAYDTSYPEPLERTA